MVATETGSAYDFQAGGTYPTGFLSCLTQLTQVNTCVLLILDIKVDYYFLNAFHVKRKFQTLEYLMVFLQ